MNTTTPRRSPAGSPPTTPPPLLARRRWPRWIGETRTRILLLYVVAMLGVTAIAIPIFRGLFFAAIDARVREDLTEEIDELQAEYETWAATASSGDSVQGFIDAFIGRGSPEDDNYHIFFIDDAFYQANPPSLPSVVQPDSELINRWRTLSSNTPVNSDAFLIAEGESPSNDPAIGAVLYQVMSLNVDGERKGLFIATHFTAGEREEALVGVFIFSKVAIGVVLVSFLLAWVGSRQLFAPVRSLAQTARSISEENLSERLAIRGKGELADLSSTFNAMMNRLQSAFESQRNFINDASHELRTPITIVQGHLELMGDDPREQHDTLNLVMDELDRMTRFVNDLILLAKSEQPDFLQLETIDLGKLGQGVYTKAKSLAPRNWTISNGAKGKMVGDRYRITGALLNLLNNAVQHTQDGDTIELGVTTQNRMVRLWVRDTGEGIAPKDQARIFDRFARVANTYRPSEGAGLGLAIVKAIADAHHGHIELISQQGVGSTFTLVIPLDPGSENQAA